LAIPRTGPQAVQIENSRNSYSPPFLSTESDTIANGVTTHDVIICQGVEQGEGRVK
jgi:hypothetical protein